MKINMNWIQKIFLIFIFTLTASQLSLAHSVYFEVNENDQVVIRFGEFGDDYEEYLDTLTVWIWYIPGKSTVKVS